MSSGETSDSAPTVPSADNFTAFKIGAIFVIVTLCCLAIFAFRLLFNCIIIDFCCRRDFRVLREIRSRLKSICCCLSTTNPESSSGDDIEGQNITMSRLPKIPLRRRMELLEHLSTGINDTSFTCRVFLGGHTSKAKSMGKQKGFRWIYER